MNLYRRWFFTGLIIVAIELGLVALLNYIVDPYGVFRYGAWRHDVSRQFRQPSKNFIKTRYVSSNPQKYDCLIFGSSRVNAIDGRNVKELRCYNMNYGDGLPRNHLDNLRYMLKEGARLKTVLIGLDEFSYKEDPDEHLTDYLRYPYPPVVAQNTALFYVKYLVRYSSRDMKEQFQGYRGKRAAIEYDHYGTGLEDGSPDTDKNIEQDPINYAQDPRFLGPVLTRGERVAKTLEEIRETVDMLKAYGIRPIIFINPIHKATYLAAGLEQFLTFEKALSSITSFYDFSGLNSITTNNYYYYETSHYRRNVGAMMVARMFNDSSVNVPSDFGVLVTRNTIDRHLADLRAQASSLGSAVTW